MCEETASSCPLTQLPQTYTQVLSTAALQTVSVARCSFVCAWRKLFGHSIFLTPLGQTAVGVEPNMLGCAPCLQSVLHQLVEPYTTNRHYRCCCCLQTCTATLSVSSGASRPRARTSRECATLASLRWQVSCLWCKTGCMADCLIGIRQTHLRANAWVQEHSHAPVMLCTSVKGWCISRSVRAAHLKHDRIPQ